MAPSVGMRSRTIGISGAGRRPSGMRAGTPAVGAPIHRPPGTAAPLDQLDSSGRRRIHWPLSHSSRSRSKTAPPDWTRARSKRSTSSSRLKISSSVPLDQPSSAK
jgi:hypothetical protein